MKSPIKDKKDIKKTEDDTLFGLLSMYKVYNTYFRILIDENNNIALQITDNPKKWPNIKNGRYKGYRMLKKSEIGIIKLFVKYISPVHLIDQLGPLLGVKLQEDEVFIFNNLENNGYYSLETKSEYLQYIISAIVKIIDLTPQKKYELLEKCLSKGN